ncbi:hypothetical protein BTHE68_41030 [Burkholderia sp. THE68]|nr:hypothetical protein BTHE68_41030 [Burkholderia sp. THE68]
MIPFDQQKDGSIDCSTVYRIWRRQIGEASYFVCVIRDKVYEELFSWARLGELNGVGLAVHLNDGGLVTPRSLQETMEYDMGQALAARSRSQAGLDR